MSHIIYYYLTGTTQSYCTINLSYRKDDRAMRPIYGTLKFFESLTTPTVFFPKLLMGFVVYESAYKI